MTRKKNVTADYNENTGTSFVSVESRWGRFTAYAQVAEQDLPIKNKWDGCKIAHYRCYIQEMEAKARALRERAKGAEQVYNVMSWTNDYPAIDKIKRQVDNLYRQADEAKECAENLKTNFPYFLDKLEKSRNEIRNKVKEMRKNGKQV